MDMKKPINKEELEERADYLREISQTLNKAKNSFWSYHFPSLYKRFYKKQIKYIKSQASQEILLWIDLKIQDKEWFYDMLVKQAQKYLKKIEYDLLYWN